MATDNPTPAPAPANPAADTDTPTVPAAVTLPDLDPETARRLMNLEPSQVAALMDHFAEQVEPTIHALPVAEQGKTRDLVASARAIAARARSPENPSLMHLAADPAVLDAANRAGPEGAGLLAQIMAGLPFGELADDLPE